MAVALRLGALSNWRRAYRRSVMRDVPAGSGERTLAACWSPHSAATNFPRWRRASRENVAGKKVRFGRMPKPARCKRALPRSCFAIVSSFGAQGGHRTDASGAARGEPGGEQGGEREHNGAIVKANGSNELTSKRILLTSLPVPSAKSKPSPSPAASITRPSRRIIHCTVLRCAPSAMRMPISRVRRATA